jgi:hypothetical protein
MAGGERHPVAQPSQATRSCGGCRRVQHVRRNSSFVETAAMLSDGKPHADPTGAWYSGRGRGGRVGAAGLGGPGGRGGGVAARARAGSQPEREARMWGLLGLGLMGMRIKSFARIRQVGAPPDRGQDDGRDRKRKRD